MFFSVVAQDPERPKGARVSYILWSLIRRATVAAENPTMRQSEISKKLGAEWAAMDQSQRAPWAAEAAKARRTILPRNTPDLQRKRRVATAVRPEKIISLSLRALRPPP